MALLSAPSEADSCNTLIFLGSCGLVANLGFVANAGLVDSDGLARRLALFALPNGPPSETDLGLVVLTAGLVPGADVRGFELASGGGGDEVLATELATGFLVLLGPPPSLTRFRTTPNVLPVAGAPWAPACMPGKLLRPKRVGCLPLPGGDSDAVLAGAEGERGFFAFAAASPARRAGALAAPPGCGDARHNAENVCQGTQLVRRRQTAAVEHCYAHDHRLTGERTVGARGRGGCWLLLLGGALGRGGAVLLVGDSSLSAPERLLTSDPLVDRLGGADDGARRFGGADEGGARRPLSLGAGRSFMQTRQ